MLDTLDPVTVNSIEVAMALEMMIKLRRSTMLWGPPGIGKSYIVKTLAKKVGIELLDIRAITRNPVDIAGLPSTLYESGPKPSDIPSREPTQYDRVGYTNWCRPDLIPQRGRGILFLDEINAANEDVMAALYQLILDRAIGQHRLGDEWAIVCAGNRIGDKAVVHQMPSALSDRLQHYDMVCQFEPWLTEFAIPENIHPLIVGYHRMRDKYDVEDYDHTGTKRTADNPNPFAPPPAAPAGTGYSFAAPEMPNKIEIPEDCGMLLRFMPKERSFPTPRSWTALSEEMYEIDAEAKKSPAMYGSNIERATYMGKVGRVAATELMAFATMFRAGFSVDAIVRNPDKAPVPTNPAMKCAVASALARIASRSNIQPIYDYMRRTPGEEFMVMMMREAERRDSKLTATATYRDYAVTYKDVQA